MHYLTKAGIEFLNETPIEDEEGRTLDTEIDQDWKVRQLTSRHSKKRIRPAIRQAEKTRKKLDKGGARVPFDTANKLVTMAYRRGYAGGKGSQGPNVPGGRGMAGILVNLGARQQRGN